MTTDQDAGIHCESHVSNPLDEPGDRCRKNYHVCLGKFCKDYRPEWDEVMYEDLPHRVKMKHNEFGELRVVV